MTETQTAVNNKLAMSKALGAAFLSHQVEQLEKSVNRGTNSRNHRSRDSKDPFARPNAKTSNSTRKAPDKSRRPPRDSTEWERRTSNEKGSRRRSAETEKDADVIIVDASLLIHGVHHLKRWCREGRREVVIVPLEALNTLDLLKKGLTPLGSRARGASRILEAQVGSNPRIQVQKEDAYVLWDKLAFSENDEGGNHLKPSSSPEWVRRVICCARWELDHFKPSNKEPATLPPTKPRVILAVCPTPGSSPQQTATAKLLDTEGPLAPVPGPAPTNVHISKYEQRSNGSMVTQWAHRTSVPVTEFPATPIDHPGPRSFDDDEPVRPQHNPPRNKSRTYTWNRNGASKGNAEELVERPPAVAAMMEMVSQSPKVIKVLARGEKLEPDT